MNGSFNKLRCDRVKRQLLQRFSWLSLTFVYLTTGASTGFAQGNPTAAISHARGAIAGSVVDSSGKPLQSAVINVFGTERSTRTDSAGAFEFRDLPAGSYRVDAKRLGYQPQSRAATIADGQVVTIKFALVFAPQLLETRKITSQLDILPPGAPQRMFDFYRRRKTGTGTYISRDQIERAGSVRATLGAVSGIRLYTAPGGQVRGIKFIRCSGTIRDGASAVAYFLDGIQTTDGVFALLSDTDIEALEIYKGPASMPAEAAGSGCAAVFIWTRR